MEKTSKKNALRTSILARKAPAKPIGFTLDEVRAIAKTNTPKTVEPKPMAKGKAPAAAKVILASDKPQKSNHVKAASLADILGFNPHKPSAKAKPIEKPVPEKFKRYHRLLLDLREHLTGQIDQHSEETLKRSSKDDAGDLSSYGQHMADAGTDTFDRDFALSLVANEQEALSEIEAAIERIYKGTYGLCEISGQPIAKDRLLAVPFTRHSAEAQKEIERNRHRVRTQAGLFSEHGDDTGKMMDTDDSGD
ncbi:MAG: TraR/DksA C4-type zinc finger protein [Opitutaceae bacterium]|nr:TraR/DksA C4-type zinc finger protein [Opitutaceae bacterium]